MHTGDTTADYEADARQRSLALEHAGRIRAGFTEAFYPLTRGELRELRRLKACVVLATNPDVFCALVRGEAVPAHRLDQAALANHRRRTVHS